MTDSAGTRATRHSSSSLSMKYERSASNASARKSFSSSAVICNIGSAWHAWLACQGVRHRRPPQLAGPGVWRGSSRPTATAGPTPGWSSRTTASPWSTRCSPRPRPPRWPPGWTPCGHPVRRAVLTSSHIEYVGGSSVFWMAARYGRSQTSALLDQPPNLGRLPAPVPRVGRRVRRRVHHPSRLPHRRRRGVAHAGGVRGAHRRADGREPDGGRAVGRRVVRRGHVQLRRDPQRLRRRPRGLGRRPGRRRRDGAPPSCPASARSAVPTTCWPCRPTCTPASRPRATRAAIPAGPWDEWTDRHLDAVNVERAAMLAAGDPSVPPSMLRAIGLGRSGRDRGDQLLADLPQAGEPPRDRGPPATAGARGGARSTHPCVAATSGDEAR